MPTDIQIVKPDLIIEGNNIATPKRAALNFINATVTDDAINNQTNVTIPPSGITIGTTAITSGEAGRVLFEGAGNVLQEDSSLFWDNTNKRLGVGTATPTSTLDVNGSLSAVGHGYFTQGVWANIYHNLWGAEVFRITLGTNNVGIGTTSPAAKLDIKSQGALSTDIAFRIRNSADTANILTVAGNGDTRLDGRIGLNTSPSGAIDLYLTAGSGTTYGIYAGGAYGYAAIASSPNTTSTRHNFYAPSCGWGGAYKVENSGGSATVTGVRIGFSATDFNNSAYNNVAFSADIANSGGGEALAFDCVNGNFKFGTGTGTKIGTATGQKFAFWNKTPIVQPTTAITASTLISNLGAPLTDTDTFDGYTLKQVVKALKNLGILA